MEIKTLATYILATYGSVSPMKLQKLTYYVKVWSLVGKRPLVDAPFNKWAYGPVNPKLYHAYKAHGAKPIPQPTSIPTIAEDDKQLIDMILSAYADKSAFALSAMTHKESPWVNTPDNATISDEAILDYYSSLSFAKNFQNSGQEPFYFLQDDNWHSFTLDMSPDDAEEMASISSYAEYQIRRAKAKQMAEPFLQEIWPIAS